MRAGVVLLDQYQRGLLVNIAALTLHRKGLLGQQPHRFAPAVASLLPTGDAPLGELQVHLGDADDTWVGELAAIGQRGKGLQAQIKPRRVPGERQGSARHLGTSAPRRRRSPRSAHHPAGALERVTVLGVPSKGRDQRTATRPILERTRQPLSSCAPLPYSLQVKRWKRSRPCKRGHPAWSPRGSRWKNACEVLSRRANTSCSTWRWIAASSGNAACRAVNSASCWLARDGDVAALPGGDA